MEEQSLVIANAQNVVTKSNALIEASYKLGTIEQKLILTLASFIEPFDSEFKNYTLSVKDFSKLLGVSSDSKYSEMKKITKELMKKVFEIRIGNETIQISWLSSARYDHSQGTVSLSFDPLLKPFFLQLKKEFTTYRLGNISKLKSSYSIRLYELLKQYQLIKERTILVEDLRAKLGTEDLYPKYANFKQRVIKPAQKELKEKSDLCFEFEEIKKGRAVHKIKFLIKANQLIDTDQEIITGLPNEQIPKIPSTTMTSSPYESKLREWGVDDKTISQLVITYGQKRIESNIAYTEGRKSTIKTISSYVVNAIKKDYANSPKKPIREEIVPEFIKKEKAAENQSHSQQQEAYLQSLSSQAEFEEFLLSTMKTKRRVAKKYKHDLTEIELNKIEIDCVTQLIREDIGKRLQNGLRPFNINDFSNEEIKQLYKEVLEDFKQMI